MRRPLPRITKAPVRRNLHRGPFPSSYSTFEASSRSFLSVWRSKVGRRSSVSSPCRSGEVTKSSEVTSCPSLSSRSQSLLLLKVAAGVIKPGLFIWSEQGDVLPGAAGRSMARGSLVVWELFLLLIRQVWTFEVGSSRRLAWSSGIGYNPMSLSLMRIVLTTYSNSCGSAPGP